ncbi:MAG: YggS family pyridoxal phosphate-dependent enzyme [Clostridia bacterium]|nr:YggS family pyridoxal phosphate-dependent enzyme [Clostridia bacterium]
MSIYDNVMRAREGVAAACAAAGRPESEVTLMAVSKTFPAEVVNEAIAAGITDVGENYVQEFVGKREGIDPAARLHFIGHLQSNKAKLVVGKVDLIHSVDRLSLAKELSRLAVRDGVTQGILMEINVGGEESKSGASFEGAMELAEQIATLPGLKLRGLMTIPPADGAARGHFERLYQLFLDMKQKKLDNTDISVLSMGMSGDYREAIACGSTVVRLGTAIFGPRQTVK